MQNQGVQDALDFLGAGARMTGSGSAVFAHAATLEEARKKLQMLPDDASGFAVSTLDRHPLYHWVER
jgi:4-diphosphocytidyl-2-C-methyl-D-erythritol kinase